MLQAIKELGEVKLQQEGRDSKNIIEEALTTVIQDPNESGNYPYVFVLVLRKVGNEFVYDRVQLEQTDKAKILRYLYRRGSSQGPDRTPTSRITEISKTFQGKLIAWFNKFGSEAPFFANMNEALKRDKDRILQDLQREWQGIYLSLKKQRKNAVLTVATEDNGGLRYPGDFPEFRDLLQREIRQKYSEVLQRDHVCSICGERKYEVYGGALSEVFKFYTLDKPGYIAGGFRRDDAWKNSPICLDCMLKIEEGRKFISDNLEFKMGGQRYWLIPRFFVGVPEARKVIMNFFQIVERREDILKNKRLARISSDEREILYKAANLKDVLNFNFFFFLTQKGSSIPHEITLMVEDVLPSRISVIFEAKRRVDSCELLHDIKIKREYVNVEFQFDVLREFTPNRKAFLEVIDKIFRGIRLDREIVFSWIMGRIRQNFITDGYLKLLVLRSLSALLFFSELGVLKKHEKREKGGGVMTELGPKADEFFGKYVDSFPNEVSKGIFLLGVLTQKLLNIQYMDRDSTPFRKNLKGLKMRERDFKELLPKIQNKLEEYNKNYYRSLETLISDYFLQTGRNWNMSIDEMNFYFVMGMNLHEVVSRNLGIIREKTEEEE